MQVRKRLKRAKNVPRFAKRHIKGIVRPAVVRLRMAKQKASYAKSVLTDKKQRYFLLQKKSIQKYETAGKWEQAANTWNGLINTFGADTPASFFVGLSRAYQGSGDLDRAMQVLQDASDRFPKNKDKPVDQDLRDWLAISREKAELSYQQRIDNIEEYKERITDYQKQKEKRAKGQLKIAVFAAVAGGYDTLKPPAVIDPRFDYVFFTDTPVDSIGIYDIRPLPYMDADPTRSARFVKTHPHTLLSEYDIAMWVDANLLITGDLFPITDSVLKSGRPFGAMRHPVRKTPFEEMDAVIRQGRDDAETVREQERFYKGQGYDTTEMIESNILVYDLREGKLDSFLNEWWSQINRFSRRDQFSINYSLDKHGIKPHWFTDRPYTSRNHKAVALTDHVAETGDTTLYPLLDLLDTEVVRPNKGKQYSTVKSGRLKGGNESITVVVPVHNALEEVKKCLESIKRHKHSNQDLIILDDGSKPDTQQYLEDFYSSNKSWTRLIRHEEAHGFTRTANEGMKNSKADLTIILNSDTIVTKDWAQKMADVTFSNKGVGIVGPLSSAASHQSVPNHNSSGGQTAINALPDGLTVEDMNKYCEKWSFTNYFPRVPLVHGFCFGVTREALDAVGYLDEESFPRGYGEENDYCFRAVDSGFSLIIATNTYVFHHKSKSFVSDERRKLMDEGMDQLIRKHGQLRINRAVATMQKNPVLVELREKFASLY